MQLPDFNLGNAGLLALLGAAGTAIVSMWGQIRNVAKQVSSLLVVQTIVHDDGGLYRIVARYCRTRCQRLPSGIVNYRGVWARLTGRSFASTVPFRIPGNTAFISGEHGHFLLQSESCKMTLLSIRGMADPEALIRAAVLAEEELNQATKDQESRYTHIRLLGHAGEPVMASYGEAGNRASKERGSLDEAVPNGVSGGAWTEIDMRFDHSFMYSRDLYCPTTEEEPLHGLFFPEEVMALITKAKKWKERGTWYVERSIPWRTGFLLYGPGGTGKSTLARVVAQILGIPLYQFYLSTFSDSELVREWNTLCPPCVVLLEDFDNVFHGREPVTQHKSLSFDTVLNLISGVGSQDGILLIVTTNKLDMIDAALGNLNERGEPTRPGRIDHVVRMGECTETMRRDLVRHMLRDWPEVHDGLIAAGEGMTPAQFQNLCINTAFQRVA